MSIYALLSLAFFSAAGALVFSTLTYALRETSRSRLHSAAERAGLPADRAAALVDRREDHILSTAVCRYICNILLLASFIALAEHSSLDPWAQALLAIVLTLVVGLLVAVAFPHALARHGGDALIARARRLLELLRLAVAPFAVLMRLADKLVARAVGDQRKHESHQIERDILSVVEEGQKEGLVNDQERTMIESVIQFRDTTAAQIMTPRPQVIGLDAAATLNQVKQTIEDSGHSRLPVYRGTLDQIVGVLYARDLLHHLGQPADAFDIRSATRPALYVPETKPLRDLLNEFRLQKVHMAIVLDEYGGTAGLVTIEDVLEELVGDISDEHEPTEQATLRRVSPTAWEADAGAYLEEVNRVIGLQLPEDAGYETLGGFVSTTLGRIPLTGTTFEHPPARFTILDAEPQRVNRVRVELLPPTP